MITTEPAVTHRTTFVALAADVLSGAGELAKAHGAQIKGELNAQKTKAATAGGLLAAGALFAVLGLFAGMTTLAHVLMAWLGWGPAAAWGVVAALFLAAAVILAAVALSTFKKVRLVPTESLQSIQESLQWVTRR